MKTPTTLSLLLISVFFTTIALADDDVVIAAQKEGYTSFHDAVVDAGIYEHAKKDVDEKGSLAPFTVFVPTNEAFGAIKDLDSKKKKKIITFHVVPGKKIAKPADEMKDGVSTVGEQLLFAENDKIHLDDSDTKATIVKGPIEARNGIIYVIDTVLLPAGEEISKTEEPKKESVKESIKEESKKPEPAPTQASTPPTPSSTPAPIANTPVITEQTAQALTTSMTQLTQSIQLLIHVIQQAQTAETSSAVKAPIIVN